MEGIGETPFRNRLPEERGRVFQRFEPIATASMQPRSVTYTFYRGPDFSVSRSLR